MAGLGPEARPASDARAPRHPYGEAVEASAAAFRDRALPAIFFSRCRAASVLPWMRVIFARGIARRFFFFCFSIFRSDRMAISNLI